jgi:hypothetical protein
MTVNVEMKNGTIRGIQSGCKIKLETSCVVVEKETRIGESHAKIKGLSSTSTGEYNSLLLLKR